MFHALSTLMPNLPSLSPLKGGWKRGIVGADGPKNVPPFMPSAKHPAIALPKSPLNNPTQIGVFGRVLNILA